MLLDLPSYVKITDCSKTVCKWKMEQIPLVMAGDLGLPLVQFKG